MELFPLYPIMDKDVLTRREWSVDRFAGELKAAGVRLLQYRNKFGGPQKILQDATVIRELFAGGPCRLIMNDRADLAVLGEWGGVHVGQGDLSPEEVRRVVGPDRWIGVSTHNDAQTRAAELSSADYVAVGPVFATGTKIDAEPIVGLDGVRRARALTTKPIVAIGGINRDNARSVIDAGADSVAVIGALIVDGESVEKVARDFLDILQ